MRGRVYKVKNFRTTQNIHCIDIDRRKEEGRIKSYLFLYLSMVAWA